MSMKDISDFEAVIEQNHRAVDQFTTGDNKPLEDLYSRLSAITNIAGSRSRKVQTPIRS